MEIRSCNDERFTPAKINGRGAQSGCANWGPQGQLIEWEGRYANKYGGGWVDDKQSKLYADLVNDDDNNNNCNNSLP